MWKRNKITPDKDPTSIGNILVELGLITQNQLVELVSEFQKSKEKLLGEFILEHSNLTLSQIELALVRQKRLRGEISNRLVNHTVQLSNESHKRILQDMHELSITAKAIAK